MRQNWTVKQVTSKQMKWNEGPHKIFMFISWNNIEEWENIKNKTTKKGTQAQIYDYGYRFGPIKMSKQMGAFEERE